MSAMLRRSPTTAWKRLGDELLIVASDTNTLTVLNDTGARVWELLEQARSLDELVATIVEEFAVDEGAARRDVAQFVEALDRQQLVERVG